MKKLLTLALILFAAPCFAEPINLECVRTDVQSPWKTQMNIDLINNKIFWGMPAGGEIRKFEIFHVDKEYISAYRHDPPGGSYLVIDRKSGNYVNAGTGWRTNMNEPDVTWLIGLTTTGRCTKDILN